MIVELQKAIKLVNIKEAMFIEKKFRIHWAKKKQTLPISRFLHTILKVKYRIL